MDEELRSYLKGMEDRHAAGMAHLEKLVTDLHESTQREMNSRFDAVDARFNGVDLKLASIDARLKVQAGLMQSGARAMARLSAYTEESEMRWVDLATRVLAIEQKLEGRGAK